VTEPRLIIRLAARGDGVTDDGRFVDGAVPGDVVRFTPDGPVVQPGPHHVVPPCRHFPECGGCQVQHVGDQAYADWVAARIVHAVESAGVSIGAVEPTHLSPPNTRRRASMRAVRRGRQVLLGFNTEGTHQIVDMQECHILLPRLFALVAPLRELLVHVAAEGKAIGVVLTDSDAGVDLLLTNVEARSLTAIERLTAFASDRKLARLSVESSAGIEVIAEPRTPTVRLGDVPVALPPASFLQATLDGEAALQAAVLSATAGAKSVADLFCGLGTFALPASRTARVFAADSAGPATQALAAAAKSAGRRIEVAHRDLFRRPLTPAELARFDAVILDPPRAGASAQVAQLARSKVPRIAAVSCNPTSFARDAAVLSAGGYRLLGLWPVGQFRWSTHVELVAQFCRR
jgi:23S rRNA (uracil1939-C5)-methyltransferase